jgi:hypothetical protein
MSITWQGNGPDGPKWLGWLKRRFHLSPNSVRSLNRVASVAGPLAKIMGLLLVVLKILFLIFGGGG